MILGSPNCSPIMQQIIKKILGFVVCLMVVSCKSFNCCDVPDCVDYQDVVRVTVSNYDKQYSVVYIDSVVIKTNDSIIMWQGDVLHKTLGSKTHNAKFPIDIKVQLFINGKGLKELSFEMQKNTKLTFFTKGGNDCDFLNEEPKGHNYTDYSPLNDDGYCWIIVGIDMKDGERCFEYEK